MKEAFTTAADFPITKEYKEALAAIRPILRIRDEREFNAFISGERIHAMQAKLIDAFPEIEGWERARFTDNVKLLLEDVQAEHELKLYESLHLVTERYDRIPRLVMDDMIIELRDSLKDTAKDIALLCQGLIAETPEQSEQQPTPPSLIYVI